MLLTKLFKLITSGRFLEAFIDFFFEPITAVIIIIAIWYFKFNQNGKQKVAEWKENRINKTSSFSFKALFLTIIDFGCVIHEMISQWFENKGIPEKRARLIATIIVAVIVIII